MGKKEVDIDLMWPVGKRFSVSFTVEKKGAVIPLIGSIHGNLQQPIDGLNIEQISFNDNETRFENKLKKINDLIDKFVTDFSEIQKDG